MKRIFTLILLVGIAAVPGNALVIPYAGGKQADSVAIRTVSYNEYLGTQSALVGTTIVLGNEFSLQFRWKAGNPPANLCSMTDDEYGKIYLQVSTPREARQLADSGTAWQSHSVRPPDSALVALNPLPISGDSVTPVGFRFALQGTCEGTYQTATGKWNRVIFVHNGSRYAKFSIVAKQDTTWGSLPSYGYIKTISFRYVINETNELSDPVSIAPATKTRLDGNFRKAGELDFYNLLGVRLNRAAGLREVVVPRRP